MGERYFGKRVHTLASMFPLMQGEALEGLAADIRVNGLLDPIVLLQDEIVDGRNRCRACELAGIPPRFADYDGDPEKVFEWIVSRNFHRRDLTPSQRALIAGRIAERRGVSSDKDFQAVAEELGVTLRHAQYARTVLRRGVPALIGRVERGETSIFAADKISMLPAAEQEQLAEAGAEAIKAALHEIGPTGRFTGLSPKAVKPKPVRLEPELYTPWGKPLADCTPAELEACASRQAEMTELAHTLATQLPPDGTARELLGAKEWARLVKASRG